MWDAAKRFFDTFLIPMKVLGCLVWASKPDDRGQFRHARAVSSEKIKLQICVTSLRQKRLRFKKVGAIPIYRSEQGMNV